MSILFILALWLTHPDASVGLIQDPKSNEFLNSGRVQSASSPVNDQETKLNADRLESTSARLELAGGAVTERVATEDPSWADDFTGAIGFLLKLLLLLVLNVILLLVIFTIVEWMLKAIAFSVKRIFGRKETSDGSS